MASSPVPRRDGPGDEANNNNYYCSIVLYIPCRTWSSLFHWSISCWLWGNVQWNGPLQEGLLSQSLTRRTCAGRLNGSGLIIWAALPGSHCRGGMPSQYVAIAVTGHQSQPCISAISYDKLYRFQLLAVSKNHFSPTDIDYVRLLQTPPIK